MPDSLESVYQEQLRMRERLHALEGTTAALRLQQTAMATTLEHIEQKVDDMATADQIAKKVAAAVERRRTVRLSRFQKGAVFALALVPAVNLCLRLAGIEGL